MTPSDDFDEFLDFLGERVTLEGWEGFRAGLDVKSNLSRSPLTSGNTTGTNSVYTRHENLELMFHVAPLLPYYREDKQQVERKRHIGNGKVISSN